MTKTLHTPSGGSAAVPQVSSRPASAEQAANRVAERRGEPLPATVQHAQETNFGADFSNVRVHSDRDAAEAAGALGARAFTVGSHIVFNEGEFRPSDTAGQRLLAHELAHVEQQRDAGGGHAAFRPNAAEEREAHLAADGVAKGQSLPRTALSRGGPRRIQADDGKTPGAKSPDNTSKKQQGGARITFVLRAPDDAYTRDITDYTKNTLNEQVVEIDNIQEAAEYVAKYAQENHTKVSQIRLVGHGSTAGGIKMTPQGESTRRFVTAQELADMSADQKLKATAASGMAPGATVEFWGCYVGGTEQTGKAVGGIFNADFTATDATMRTANDQFLRPADKGEAGTEIPGHKGQWIEAHSSQEIDDRVAKGDKQLGASFEQWLLNKGHQMEADGDLPHQPDKAALIAATRAVFDRSSGRILRLEVHSGKQTLHRGDKQKWLKHFKTVKP